MKKLDSHDEVIEYGASVIQAEAHALEALQARLNGDFAYAVDCILSMGESGHVIVSGMGKAGFVGQKISATLASTGIPSFFLHPAEAVHGDLGRYRKTDVALILTNSGETEEILRIIPQIKRMGCSIIAITASRDSSVGRYSDIVIEIGAIKEACPLGLAPTTSTTAMLAIGDAIAMTILEKKQFTPEQFATFHPGGKLGRQLLKIQDVMRTGENHCVLPADMNTRAALQAITETAGRPGAASVVDNSGVLIGIFTDGNLRRCLAAGDDFLSRPIAETMSKNPKTVPVSALAAEAMQVLTEFKIDQVLVVDENYRPVGLVDVQDLFEVKISLQD